MIQRFAMKDGVLSLRPAVDLSAGASQAQAFDALWIDLVNPTSEEEAQVEALLKLDIPTRQEMATLGDSARLYEDRGGLFMTASLVTGVVERRPSVANVTFVLTRDQLVTVRYDELRAFQAFEAKCVREPGAQDQPDKLLAALLESVVARIAEILTQTETVLEAVTIEIFREPGDPPPPDVAKSDLQSVVKRLGKANALLAKLRESLLSLNRMLIFLRQGAGAWLHADAAASIDALERDLASLTEYESHMVGEVGFLLNATLGLINIDQNQIIKVFSIASVLFLPPTLVGTIYGMNFEMMPELKWAVGYPLALALMVASAILPYWFFRRRGWL